MESEFLAASGMGEGRGPRALRAARGPAIRFLVQLATVAGASVVGKDPREAGCTAHFGLNLRTPPRGEESVAESSGRAALEAQPRESLRLRGGAEWEDATSSMSYSAQGDGKAGQDNQQPKQAGADAEPSVGLLRMRELVLVLSHSDRAHSDLEHRPEQPP